MPSELRASTLVPEVTISVAPFGQKAAKMACSQPENAEISLEFYLSN